MKTSNPYLYFDGRARDAMSFYGAVFGAEAGMTPYADTPPDLYPGADPQHLMHSELHVPGLVLMACDVPPGMAFAPGGQVTISITCDSRAELDRLYAALSDGGEATTPPYDAFWGDRIGLLTDRFGIGWMLSFR